MLYNITWALQVLELQDTTTINRYLVKQLFVITETGLKIQNVQNKI